jgi:hypothetical protein
VQVTEATCPTPYLDHDRREVVVDGLTLTMISPAHTRQIADHSRRGIRISPVQAAARPMPQITEAAACGVSKRLTEIVELIPGAAPVHRYMAPLKVSEACLACHSKQGYQLGQIRGGISVTMPAADLLAIRDGERSRSTAAHLLMFAVVAALLDLLVRRTRHHVLALERLAQEQEKVIAERTHALSEANAELESELANRELASAVFDRAPLKHLITDAGGHFVRSIRRFRA